MLEKICSWLEDKATSHGCIVFFHPSHTPPHPDSHPPTPSRSPSFHWRSGRGDRQHGHHQQPPGAGVSGHWNTCTCHHVRSPPQCTEESMQYSMRSDSKTFFFCHIGGIKMAKRSGRGRGCGCQPTVGGWLFLVLRSPTRPASSAWPLTRQETTRGTSTWSSTVKY